jgi:hypothetical protein
MESKKLVPLKPYIVENRKVFFITHGFPPVPAGSSVINGNLLSCFDPESFVVLTCRMNLNQFVETRDYINKKYIFRFIVYPYRLNKLFYSLQIFTGTLKTIFLALIHNPACIIAVYPDFAFLKIARKTAQVLKIPLIAYFHDTLVETMSTNSKIKKASLLQKQVFTEAKKIFVMSEGIKELYKHKYHLETTSLEHTYIENIQDSIDDKTEKLNQAFWGGDVYGINKCSARRLSEGVKNVNMDLFIAINKPVSYLHKIGIDGNHLRTGYFSKRLEYLEYLKQNKILFLGIDWADESETHFDELSTIFPTKTPEYLASGGIVVAHCPENYFLAKFINTHQCGVVISDRNPAVISETLLHIKTNPQLYITQRENALKAAKIFDSNRIGKLFKEEVNQSIKS